MPTNNRESLETQVLKTANRLRLIQVDFSDESEQTRTGYLCEEIERALKTVLPEQRNVFLEKLMARFPSGHVEAALRLQQKEPASREAIDAAELQDHNFVVRRLLELAPALSADQKETVAGSLQEVGFRLSGSGESSVEFGEDLKATLGLGDEAGLEAGRIAALIVLLADFVFKLEPLVWKTWGKLSPRSSIRPTAALKTIAGQFVCDASGASGQGLESELKSLQRLVAAMITAVGQVGYQFARRHLTKLSPSEISDLVRMEGGSVLVSHEVKCWRKYKELADALSEDSIETEIRKTIAGYTESLVKGSER